MSASQEDLEKTKVHFDEPETTSRRHFGRIKFHLGDIDHHIISLKTTSPIRVILIVFSLKYRVVNTAILLVTHVPLANFALLIWQRSLC